MKINRELLIELYMEELENIVEVCGWKTHFTPEEIVNVLATIIEKNEALLLNHGTNDKICS